MKALVTGAGALLGQGVIRALRASTLECEIIGADPSPLSAGLYWADRARLLPLARDPSFDAAFRELLLRERPDVVLVGTDVELPMLAARRAELERETGARVIVSDPRVIEIADDKWLTARFLHENGLPYPRSALRADVDRLIDEIGFPLIVKPRRGARSVGVREVNTRAELAEALSHADDPVVQERIGSADHEYTAGVLCFGGEPEASIVMRRDLRDGNTYRAFTAEFPDLNRAMRAAARALDPFGPVNFQFRLREGVPVIFEINARFSGTTPLRARAGFNEVEMVLRRVLYEEPIVQPEIRELVMLRHWEETVAEPGQVERLERRERG